MITARVLLILIASFMVLGISPMLVLALPERFGDWLFGDRHVWMAVPWLVFYTLPAAAVCVLFSIGLFLWR